MIRKTIEAEFELTAAEILDAVEGLVILDQLWVLRTLVSEPNEEDLRKLRDLADSDGFLEVAGMFYAKVMRKVDASVLPGGS